MIKTVYLDRPGIKIKKRKLIQELGSISSLFIGRTINKNFDVNYDL